MNVLFIFAWAYAAMIALAFAESYVEGRNAWDKGKCGWKFSIFGIKITGYHFFLYVILLPFLFAMPLVVYGPDKKLAGILLSAYLSGMVVEDFFWYIVNPKVKFREFWSPFSDYYPWIRYKGKKIVPALYVVALVLAFLSWILLWR